MQTIKTISFPDDDLLARLQPLPHGIRSVLRDLKSAFEDGELDDIDAVILPYVNATDVLEALSQVPNLKFVQTETTGYDVVIAAAGGTAAIANASGVHAAVTAEIAVGLLLAKLRGIDQAVRDQVQEVWRPWRGTSLCDRKVLLVGSGESGRKSRAGSCPSK